MANSPEYKRAVAQRYGQCLRKKAYDDPRRAALAVRSIGKRSVTGVHSYLCPFGGKGQWQHWHVGHINKSGTPAGELPSDV